MKIGWYRDGHRLKESADVIITDKLNVTGAGYMESHLSVHHARSGEYFCRDEHGVVADSLPVNYEVMEQRAPGEQLQQVPRPATGSNSVLYYCIRADTIER